MSDIEIDWPWQYSFPPFFTCQPHAKTRMIQITTWRALILDYCKAAKISILDVNEATSLPLFSNPAINRKLDTEMIQLLLKELEKTGNAAPIDKQKTRYEIYWHTLSEWSLIIYKYISDKGYLNTVMTLYELVEGDDTVDAEFHGLDNDILIKALRVLEGQGKCELMLFDDNQGVKFF